MEDTADRIKQEIKCLEDLLQEMDLFEKGHKDSLGKYCLEYLRSKIGGKPLRAYFTRKMYDYLNVYPSCQAKFLEYENPDNLFLQKLPFIFEVVITIQYLENQILDEKREVRKENRGKVNQNLISSNILRELLFIYIDEISTRYKKHTNQFHSLKKRLRQLLLVVDIGQYVDKNHNTYKYWKEGVPNLKPTHWFDDVFQESVIGITKRVQEDVQGKANFIETYFRRIYLSNVYFFRCITEVLVEIADYKDKYARPLYCFSVQYGFMLQLINDYADFAYSSDKREREILKTAGKKTSDIFADLYNYNVTLPLIYHLNQKSNGKIEEYLEGGYKEKTTLKDYHEQIVQEICGSNAINKTISRSEELSEMAKKHLDQENKHTVLFIDMCNMATNNKYYMFFKEY